MQFTNELTCTRLVQNHRVTVGQVNVVTPGTSRYLKVLGRYLNFALFADEYVREQDFLRTYSKLSMFRSQCCIAYCRAVKNPQPTSTLVTPGRDLHLAPSSYT